MDMHCWGFHRMGGRRAGAEPRSSSVTRCPPPPGPLPLQGVFHVEGKYTSRGPRLIEVNCRMVRPRVLGGVLAASPPRLLPAPLSRVEWRRRRRRCFMLGGPPPPPPPPLGAPSLRRSHHRGLAGCCPAHVRPLSTAHLPAKRSGHASSSLHTTTCPHPTNPNLCAGRWPRAHHEPAGLGGGPGGGAAAGQRG